MCSPGRGCGFFLVVAAARERVVRLVGIVVEGVYQPRKLAHAQYVQDHGGVVDFLATLIAESGVERGDDDAVEPGDPEADAGQVPGYVHVATRDHVDHCHVPCHIAQVVCIGGGFLFEEPLDDQTGSGG